jgi:putative nucleotidyltransferase with HDIG domain
MKTQQFLQSLSQQLSQWRRRYKVLCRRGKLLELVNSPKEKSYWGQFNRAVLKNFLLYLSPIDQKDRHSKFRQPVKQTTKSFKTNSGIEVIICRWLYAKRSSLILVMAIASLTGIMGHKLYNQPQLKVGTAAPQTFIAPLTAKIADEKQTEAKRKEVSKSSTPVLMVDAQTNEQINQNLRQLLADGSEIRATAGSFPFFDVLILSIPTQSYLRACNDSEWQKLLASVENQKKPKLGFSPPKNRPASGIKLSSSLPSSDTALSLSKLDSLEIPAGQKNEFTQGVAELTAYRITTSESYLSSLITQISQARRRYAQARDQLAEMETLQGENVLLNLSDEDWVRTETGINQSVERILTQGIPDGLPQEILQNAVSLQVQTLVPQEAESLATKLLLAVLQPNLKQDEAKTQLRAQQAAAGVQTVVREVHRGQVIVSKGEKITAWNFQVLEHYHLIRRQVNWFGLVGLAGLVSAAIGCFVWAEQQVKIQLRQRDRLLVLLLTLSTPGVLVMGVPYTTWSAIGLLLGSFYGPTLGVTVVTLSVLLIPMSLEVGKIGLMAGAAGGILSSCVAQRLRSREELALLGVVIALTQGGIYLILKILMGAAFNSTWYLIFPEAGLFALSGLAWSIVALGLSPYLEKLFDLITPIRLAELANPNRPLLKRLATETPGTFQHTLLVATLAEAAAKQLGCNVELVRAGTLYHDIGKMHDPLGFIENQMGGENKHDTKIKDPWKSAAIIKKHVTEGLVMAQKHSLPTAVQAFIPEHQGTMAIAYFYHQAQQIAQKDPSITVNVADFSYDGPIPQSRETGIVMLADSCEAAMRSLKDGTTEQAFTMVNNILRAKWQEGQLADSGLTREEMSKIAQIFVDVWQQFHHKRIAYPKLKASN